MNPNPSLSLRSTLALILAAATLCLGLAFADRAGAAAPIEPGPAPSRIVLNPTATPATSQLVTWRTDAATTTGGGEIVPVAGGATVSAPATVGATVNFEGWPYSSIHHTVEFTGLAPDTAYRYRVGGAAGWSPWMELRTARTDGAKPWNLMYFGDAQNGLDASWRPVVDQAFERTPDAELALHAGDLINRSSNDYEWSQWFDGVAGHAERINTMPITGNHERSGDSDYVQFREHFANPGNGPAGAAATVWYTDYQGVRLIALDGNGTAMFEQIDFLRDALANNPNRWSVVSIHQPVFSGSVGRDNFLLRDLLLPILEEFNVDLVLQGHDHVYARGHLRSRETSGPGVHTGPTFVVSVAGPKYYNLAPAEENNWTENGATRVAGYQHTSTYQPIRFDGDRIFYRSYIAAKGDFADSPGGVGDLLDSFTIIKKADGSKEVHEGIVERKPGEEPKQPVTGKPKKLKIQRVSRLRRAGAARVVVSIPAAGTLRVTGKAKGRRFKGIRPLVRKPGKARKLTVKLAPTAKAKRHLRRKGRLGVRAVFTFKPRSGKAQRVTRDLTLVRARR